VAVEYRSRPPKPQLLIARVSEVAFLGSDSFGPQYVVFDAVTASFSIADFAVNAVDQEYSRDFSLLRIRGAWLKLLNVLGTEAPAIGAWFELEISPDLEPSAIRAQQAHLAQRGYTELSTVYLVRGTQLYRDDGEGPFEGPQSLGAAALGAVSKAKELAAVTARLLLSRADGSAIATVLSVIPPPARVVVRDVGQGSFSTLVADLNRPILHFDAGWALPFNRNTEPRGFNCPGGDPPAHANIALEMGSFHPALTRSSA
jgi:hypothetical protein